MRVLIAPDKFKGSLTAAEVCQAIKEGLLEKFPDADCVLFPLADGGEGTLEILTHHAHGSFVTAKVHDPFFRLIDVTYGISSDGKTAFIDMASASGLRLLKPEEKNVMKASTLGTGELILDAVKRGVAEIVLGIGGSATNDGAGGAASALGFEFFNQDGEALSPVGENLIHIQSIKTNKVNTHLKHIKFTAICDVENPLTGNNGAAPVYGPQKGATPREVMYLDEGLKNLAAVVERDLSASIENVPGAGAGGGFGGGVIAFFHGSLKKGIDIVFEFTGFEEEVKKADVIITGEGKVDSQTLQGKVVAGVASMARRHKKKVICVAGRNDLRASDINELGISKIFTLVDYASPEDAMRNGFELLKRVARSEITFEL